MIHPNDKSNPFAPPQIIDQRGRGLLSGKEASQKLQCFSSMGLTYTGQELKMSSEELPRNKARQRLSTFSLEGFNCQIT